MFQYEVFENALHQLNAKWLGALPEARYLVDDSREVGQGDYFVLRQGTVTPTLEQAQKWADQAIAKGAIAVLSNFDIDVPDHVKFIHVDDVHAHLLELAQGFYGTIPASLKLVAVTGTNGKTTTTYLIESIAKKMGLKVGVMGTISHRYPGYCEASENTTPGTLKLYKLMHGMVEAGCDLVAMEVSSHAICQNRIAGLFYDVAIFNNLGIDHLDYHKTREAYGEAKQQLFKKYLAMSYAAGKMPVAVPNATDADVMRLMCDANPAVWGGHVLSFSVDPAIDADLRLNMPNWSEHAWRGEMRFNGQTLSAALPLVGRYNIANAAAASSALIALGYDAQTVAEALARVDQVPGRMQVVREANPRVIVDFAHTPEALKSALLATRETMQEGAKLTVIFGCGGDRDPSKRPIMAKYAQEIADHVVVTSDNPRTEDPNAIIRDALAGLDMSREVSIEADRRKAIADTLRTSSSNHVVVIAGKGHEDYQIIGNQKTHFSDVEEVIRFYQQS